MAFVNFYVVNNFSLHGWNILQLSSAIVVTKRKANDSQVTNYSHKQGDQGFPSRQSLLQKGRASAFPMSPIVLAKRKANISQVTRPTIAK